MSVALLLLKAGLALGVVWVGAEFLVRGASALALKAGISALAVGLTVVAFGTSAPELVVSVRAALGDVSDIAVGNAVGSNICNVALILGLAAVVRPALVQAKVFRLDAPLLVLASVILVVLLAVGGISRVAGILFVLSLLGYTGITLRQARRESDTVRKEFREGVPGSKRAVALDLAFVVGGLVGLIIGGELLVGAAVALADSFGVTQAVIGLTIVAVGTSLPELATSVVATARGQGDIAVGNVVGSNLFNILGILGVAAVVQPLPRGNIAWIDLGFMLILSVVLLPIMRTGFKVSRTEGAILLASYVGYVLWRISV